MKLSIKNKNGEKISVVVDVTQNQKGLVFVMHGLSGNKEEVGIRTFADVFKENSYTTVLFDTRHTVGESEGELEYATVTNYYEDLNEVIEWAKKQSWYQEPFCLVGHSLGGICTALYAERNPQMVKALAPISTVVSGELSAKTSGHEEELKQWKKTGIKEWAGSNGNVKRLRWSHMEDRMKYDLLPEVKKLTMPVLMIVGEKDDRTPIYQQEVLFDALPGKKELHIIKNAPHTFKEKKQLEEIKEIFDKWIKTLK